MRTFAAVFYLMGFFGLSAGLATGISAQCGKLPPVGMVVAAGLAWPAIVPYLAAYSHGKDVPLYQCNKIFDAETITNRS